MSDSIMKNWMLWSRVEGILDKDHLTGITHSAISYMRQHPGKTQLEESAKYIKIDGFRQFSHAPHNRQVREMMSRIEKDKTMAILLSVVTIWVVIKDDLYQEMMKDLIDSPLKWGELRHKIDNDEAVEINEHIANLASSLVLSSDYSKRDIRLMICYILSEKLEKLDGEGDVMSENIETLSVESMSRDINSIWDEWLEKLKDLPADAAEWSRLDQFIEQLQQIGIEKQRIREQYAIRVKYIATVVEMISNFNEQHHFELDFFDISLDHLDKIQEMAESDIAELEEGIVTLQRYFDTYRNLKQKPVTKAIEEQQNFIEINAVSQKIFELAKMFVSYSLSNT
ncbi:hypothetical protein [Pelosinus sp. sgz500959]|uniref:hypothetical protein n=1 Tax=Pelosinus sp. sgz500959 TaxID=3242472 RepID=UPI0036721B4D